MWPRPALGGEQGQGSLHRRLRGVLVVDGRLRRQLVHADQLLRHLCAALGATSTPHPQRADPSPPPAPSNPLLTRSRPAHARRNTTRRRLADLHERDERRDARVVPVHVPRQAVRRRGAARPRLVRGQQHLAPGGAARVRPPLGPERRVLPRRLRLRPVHGRRGRMPLPFGERSNASPRRAQINLFCTETCCTRLICYLLRSRYILLTRCRPSPGKQEPSEEWYEEHNPPEDVSCKVVADPHFTPFSDCEPRPAAPRANLHPQR